MDKIFIMSFFDHVDQSMPEKQVNKVKIVVDRSVACKPEAGRL